MLKSAILGILTALTMGIGAAPGLAAEQDTPEIAAIYKLFGPEPAAEADFAPEFLSQVPIGQVREILDATKAEIGAPERVEARTADYLLITASHEIAIEIGLDGAGRIAGLLLQPAVKRDGTLEEALGRLNEMAHLAPGFAYLVTKNGTELAAKNPDEALAVGSAFKLGVLAVLKDRVGQGDLAWDQVITIKAADKSLPSGILQDWPDGTPMTLAGLAGLMISISDNSATDILLEVAGRDAVSEKLGSFAFKTREFFMLKARPELAAKFLAADDAGKGALLDQIEGDPLPATSAVSVPLTQGIEWYVPVSRLCALIEEVGDIGLLGINPGLAARTDWARIGFKGGSEIGVLNLTTALTGKDGTYYCVSATLNDAKGLDETKAGQIYGGLIAQLARS